MSAYVKRMLLISTTILLITVFLAESIIALENTETSMQEWFSSGIKNQSTIVSFGGCKTSVVSDKELDNRSCVRMEFDDNDFSGVEFVSGENKKDDLSRLRMSGVLHFKVKGRTGKEKIEIGLLDGGRDGHNKCEVKLRSDYYAEIGSGWTVFNIPLHDFSSEGVRWIANDSITEYAIINWKEISSVKFSAAKEMNYGARTPDRTAVVFIDDVRVISDTGVVFNAKQHPWRMLGEKIDGPLAADSLSDSSFFDWFTGDIAPATDVYVYDERTDFSVIRSDDTTKRNVFAAYLNDRTWSGVTLYRGKKHAIDISPYINTGSLEFKVRGGKGGEVFQIGLLDDESDGAYRKVQSRLRSVGYVRVTDQWQTVSVPFDDFEQSGMWWDQNNHKESFGKVDWKRIAEVRFAVNKFENRKLTRDGEEPVRLYFSDIRFVKKSGVFSNKRFWSSFRSDSAEQVIETFDTGKNDSLWSGYCDPMSSIKMRVAKNDLDGSRAMGFDYKISSYGLGCLVFADASGIRRNWTGFNAVKFDIYTNEKAQTCMVLVVDGKKEAWSANIEIVNGWQTIAVPFKKFKTYEWWQPDSAVLDHKMDMDAVELIQFSPGSFGKNGNLSVDNIRICNTDSDQSVAKKKIKLNQVGYYPQSVKEFVVINSTERNFVLIDNNGNVAYEGVLDDAVYWDLSGERVKKGVFTQLSKPGTYTLILQESGEKASVEIKQNVYNAAFDASVKAFYFQRSSELSEKFAGQWARAAGIPDTACERMQTNTSSDPVNVAGGWYDAGDYGKYVVNTAVTAGTLMGFAELYQDRLSDSLDIPESGNGVADVLDEVRYALDWLIRMQDSDGGVYFKVGTLEWDGFVAPSATHNKRFVIGKSTASSLDFCAAMAMASRVYKKIDKKFSKECLRRAVLAWKWAEKNPSVREPSEVGGTGPYADDTYGDEFFWAASELYASTRNSGYKNAVLQYAQRKIITSGAEWSDVTNLGWYTLALKFNYEKSPLAASARFLILDMADKNIDKMNNNPYDVPCLQFQWGSNSYQINSAILQCYAHYFTKQNKYLSSAVTVADYIFGKNSTDYCFVTGFGTLSPLQPHHRAMAAMSTTLPMPGFLVGGPNVSREDEVSMEPGVYYPDREPARSYVDRIRAYASNEVAINWNAALAFMLGYLVYNAE